MNFEKGLKYAEALTPGRERNVDKIMDSVKKDIKKIIDKNRDSIDNHIYGMLIGVDGGGRIPALILRKTFNGIYSSRGQSEIETFFLSGSRNITTEESEKKRTELEQFFKQESFAKIKQNGEKILIVEDVISSGGSIQLMVQVLQNLGFNYEIATLSFEDSKIINPTYNPEIDIKQMEEKLGSEITFGSYGEVSSLYGSKQMIGVHKDPGSIFSQPLRKDLPFKSIPNVPVPDGFVRTTDPQNQEVFAHTRDLISKISNELIVEYTRK